MDKISLGLFKARNGKRGNRMKKILHRSSCRKKRVVVRLNGEDEKRPIKSSFVLSEPKVLLQNKEEEEEAVGEEKPRM